MKHIVRFPPPRKKRLRYIITMQSYRDLISQLMEVITMVIPLRYLRLEPQVHHQVWRPSQWSYRNGLFQGFERNIYSWIRIVCMFRFGFLQISHPIPRDKNYSYCLIRRDELWCIFLGDAEWWMAETTMGWELKLFVYGITKLFLVKSCHYDHIATL